MRFLCTYNPLCASHYTQNGKKSLNSATIVWLSIKVEQNQQRFVSKIKFFSLDVSRICSPISSSEMGWKKQLEWNARLLIGLVLKGGFLYDDLMKLLINYMEHVPQSIILNWVLSQKKLFFYLFFHKFFDNFSIQVDFNQVANNYWNKTMNMKKYFFILRAQILWKNCPLLGRSLLSRRESEIDWILIVYM